MLWIFWLADRVTLSQNGLLLHCVSHHTGTISYHLNRRGARIVQIQSSVTLVWGNVAMWLVCRVGSAIYRLQTYGILCTVDDGRLVSASCFSVTYALNWIPRVVSVTVWRYALRYVIFSHRCYRKLKSSGMLRYHIMAFVTLAVMPMKSAFCILVYFSATFDKKTAMFGRKLALLGWGK